MSQLPDAESLQKEYLPLLQQIKTVQEAEQARIKLLGRKGLVTEVLKKLGGASIEEKKTYGPQYNTLKNRIEEQLTEIEQKLGAAERSKVLEKDQFDISLPGAPYTCGHVHPLTQVMESLVSTFRGLGFVCADGPEIESEFYNFDALNIPKDHPARDMHDTFYLDVAQRQLALPHVSDPQASRDPIILRTHTSPVQVRVMQQYPPPIAVVVPGRVYRHEAQDATHSAIFHQMEGLMVDEGLSFADLKGTLSKFAQTFFAPTVKTRFKPSFFPFTEPSAQMDVSCWFCSGAGCRTCKQTGWIELLGAGMVNPNVFKAVNIDPEKYSGFAFGMGIERLAMIKYGIDDLRLFYENDVRFLEQF